ncbi:MAG: preprotein translocase subunit SecG [Ideonella sp.]|jgi:preprotein translocase subunit SecG|nr:preprotein translocase subunit SecG [Ideonella sp.]MBL0147625.1 preprotein translocase subunit SecG [Ideonella sp.]
MQIWMNLVLAVQLLAAIVMIGLVLVQHGKGADMGASFGSGASGSLFGATGSANFLSRSTAVCAGVFFVSTLSLAFLTNGGLNRAPASGGSVLDRAAVTAPAASAALGSVGAGIPGAVPSTGASQAAVVATPASAAPGAIPTK